MTSLSESFVTSLLGQMTLDEKIGQLNQAQLEELMDADFNPLRERQAQ